MENGQEKRASSVNKWRRVDLFGRSDWKKAKTAPAQKKNAVEYRVGASSFNIQVAI